MSNIDANANRRVRGDTSNTALHWEDGHEGGAEGVIQGEGHGYLGVDGGGLVTVGVGHSVGDKGEVGKSVAGGVGVGGAGTEGCVGLVGGPVRSAAGAPVASGSESGGGIGFDIMY